VPVPVDRIVDKYEIVEVEKIVMQDRVVEVPVDKVVVKVIADVV
jgi:hypothetical protein